MAALTKNAKEILNDRYLLGDRNGIIIETPKQLFKRFQNFWLPQKSITTSSGKSDFSTLGILNINHPDIEDFNNISKDCQ